MTGEDKAYELIKDLCEGRVYPEKAEQNCKKPYIVYSLVSSENFTSLCNVSHGSKCDIDISVIADSLRDAKAVGVEVIDNIGNEAAIKNMYNEVDIELGIVQRVVSISIMND